MSPVKAKVIPFGGAVVIGVIETTATDDGALEVVAVAQPVVMQANANVNWRSFTQSIYCGLITAACAG